MEIYCDASMNKATRLSAWGFIIKYKNKEYIHSGHRILKSNSRHGELLAAVKALGCAKNYEVRKITIFTDFQALVDVSARLQNSKTPKKIISKLCNEDRALYACLNTYLSKYNITVLKIPSAENPAHDIAYAELKKALMQVETIAELS